MLKVIDNCELFTGIYGYNNSGELMHPYLNATGNNKGKFMYSITNSTIYTPIDLKNLIKLLLDGEFGDRGNIRMKSASEPKLHGNPRCKPHFDKALLKAYYATL